MNEPRTRRGYTVGRTVACERALVTLLRGLGPWKDSVYRYRTLQGTELAQTLHQPCPDRTGPPQGRGGFSVKRAARMARSFTRSGRSAPEALFVRAASHAPIRHSFALPTNRPPSLTSARPRVRNSQRRLKWNKPSVRTGGDRADMDSGARLS